MTTPQPSWAAPSSAPAPSQAMLSLFGGFHYLLQRSAPELVPVDTKFFLGRASASTTASAPGCLWPIFLGKESQDAGLAVLLSLCPQMETVTWQLGADCVPIMQTGRIKGGASACGLHFLEVRL